jgi:type IV secretion system protein VirD4
MLGHFTERATSRGRSRSLGGHGHTTVSRNESDQRRALLLPQEFKELGADRLVIVMENCKPILGEKIRYYREKVFTERLRAPPVVPAMDMELHFARVQGRWAIVPDEIGAGQVLRLEQLAIDVSNLPDFAGARTDIDVTAAIDQFFDATRTATTGAGGTVEPVADHEDTSEPTLSEEVTP